MGVLVLTRKLGESIIISDYITITALGIRKNKTKLGIYAPRSMPVNRLEIYERIQEEQATAGLINYGRCIGGNGMLLLNRNIGESIIIGDDIKVIVLNTHGQQVRIGIDAPKDISVHREEVYEKIRAERLGYAKYFDNEPQDENEDEKF